jgi:pimeloyl-ACP methyl ester carboxylesterase
MIESKQTILNSSLVSYYVISSGLNLPENNLGSKKSKNAIIWLHGWRSNSQNWLSIIDRISRDLSGSEMLQNYQNIAIDFPGFGNSPMPKNIHEKPWKLEDYGQIIADFITAQKFDKVILVGHSFGGRVSMLLASDFGVKYLGRRLDDKLQKIILVGSHGFSDNSSGNNLKKTFAKIVKPLFGLKILKPLKAKIYDSIGSQDYLAIPQLQPTFVNIVNRDLSTEISQIRVPIDMVWGSNDEATPVEFSNRIRDLAINTTCNIDIIKHAGHYSFLDKTDDFVEIFIKDLGGG